MNKKHIVEILWYIWVWFIWWAISHWFFSGTRSIIMAILWIIIFVIHISLQPKKEDSYWNIVLFGVVYSISIGMISWWLQHFLDSPIRSLWIIPIGYFISYSIYMMHTKQYNYKKDIIKPLLWSLIIWLCVLGAYMVIPKTWYSWIDDHHAWEMHSENMQNSTENIAHENMNHDMSTMNHSMMDHSVVISEEQFIRDMIPHHQEAVDTSRIVVAKTTNPQLQILTKNIIDAQMKEIAMMQQWLQNRYPNSTGQSHYMNMMPALDTLTWVQLDNAYIEWMIAHHQWAVSMAQGVLKLSPRAEIVQFANDVIRVQSNEIAMMQGMVQNTVQNNSHTMHQH